MAFDQFSEIDLSTILFANPLPASKLSQVNKNSQQASLMPEFFAPAHYADGDTVPLPTSPVDGYAYSRNELFYVWEWRQMVNDSPSTNYRVALAYGTVDSTGLVHAKCWRLKLHSNYVVEPDGGNASLKLRVLVIGIRKLKPPQAAVAVIGAPTDTGSFVGDTDALDTNISS